MISLSDYSFDLLPERKGTCALKWDGMNDRFGPVPKDALPMWVADMDFLAPSFIMEAIRNRASEGVFGYAQAPLSTFNSVSNWLGSVHGWKVDPEWLVSTSGVMPAVGVAIRAFSNPGDGVIIQPPVYPPFFRIIEDNERVVVENPLVSQEGYFRMDFENLGALLSDPGNRIMLLCSPHNPVGRVWGKDELERLGRLCVDTGTLLISDEIHADIVFDPFRHTPTASINPSIAENTITCVSPSKTFNIPGLQTAYGVIQNRELREAFQLSLRATAIGRHNSFGLVAGDAAYREGAPWRSLMLEYIMANRDHALSFFRREMPWVEVYPPEGTYLLWLDMSSSGLDPEEVTKRLIYKGRVVLDPGYWFGDEGRGWQRLNTACPRSVLDEGLKRILYTFS